MLANLVDRVRNTQQHYAHKLEPCEQLIGELMQRIYYLKDFDLNSLAENISADYCTSKLNTSNVSRRSLVPIGRLKLF